MDSKTSLREQTRMKARRRLLAMFDRRALEVILDRPHADRYATEELRETIVANWNDAVVRRMVLERLDMAMNPPRLSDDYRGADAD
jgi:hypothetical protein